MGSPNNILENKSVSTNLGQQQYQKGVV